MTDELLARKISDEDADSLHIYRDLRRYSADFIGFNMSRAPLVKHKSQRISPGFCRNQRVFDVRDPADLDPSHKTRCWSLVLRSAQGRLRSVVGKFRSRKLGVPETRNLKSETYSAPDAIDFASVSRAFSAIPGEFAFISASPMRNAS